MILILFMIVAVITDILYYKIPNFLIIVGSIACLITRFAMNGFYGIGEALLCCILICLLMFPFFLIHGIGAGDVKLFCMMALYLDVKTSLKCFAVTFVIAAVIAVTKMVLQKNLVGRVIKIWYYLQGLLLTNHFEAFEEKSYMKAQRNVIRLSIPAFMSVLIILKDRIELL